MGIFKNLFKKRHKSNREGFLPYDSTEKIDFSKFKNAEFIYGQWPNKYDNLNSLSNVKKMRIEKFHEKDFNSISHLENLEELEFYDLKIQSLNGLENLTKLKRLDIEKAPKLLNTNSVGVNHRQLEWIRIFNCKSLEDASSIGELPNLKHLMISKINCLDSIAFLDNLTKLDFLYLHPDATGVLNDDYYPIVNKLKELNKIEQLKNWKRLDLYLNKKFKVRIEQKTKPSELQVIFNNLSIRNWTENYKEGLKQYSKENCEKALKIIKELIDNLESGELTDSQKLGYIKLAVLDFNRLNNELMNSFIETGEREELCDIFDNIADAIGIDTQKYKDGIASEWREW